MASERAELSGGGERRREAILHELQGRAARRRTGGRVLAGVGGAAVLACVWAVAMVAVGRNGSAPHQRDSVRLSDRTNEVLRSAAERPRDVAARSGQEDLDAHIRVVRNEPLPTRACGPGFSGDAGVCLLDDAGLLRELARTGGSYGIVRVNGKVEVVSNQDGKEGGS